MVRTDSLDDWARPRTMPKTSEDSAPGSPDQASPAVSAGIRLLIGLYRGRKWLRQVSAGHMEAAAPDRHIHPTLADHDFAAKASGTVENQC